MARPVARQRLVVGLVWLAFVAASLAVIAQTRFSADLSAFLPSAPTERQRLLIDQLKDGATARLLLIGIDGGDADARATTSRKLAAALRDSGRFDAIQNGDDGDQAATGEKLFAARYALSPKVDVERFDGGLHDAIDETIGLLASPVGSRLKAVFARDPTGEIVALASSLAAGGGPRSDRGVWVSRDGDQALLLAHARAAGADLDGLADAVDTIRRSFGAAASTGVRLELSGSAVFALDARAQMKHEVARIASLGVLLIVALLTVAFASWRAVLLSIVPVATGVLAGIVSVSLGFGTVHGITLGFGTTLIGEAVDYAIYYLIQARRRDAGGSGAQRWIDSAWPTVRIGLATSVCGFGVLVFSGFPGLAQLGLFTVGGLTAAALVTRFGLTTFAPDGAGASRIRDRIGTLAIAAMSGLQRVRLLVIVAAVISIVGIAIGGRGLWSGDLTSLSPAPAAARELDQRLRTDLGTADASELITIEAGDLETALLAAEAVGRRLDPLVDQGVIAAYDSPARYLPSRATQQARLAALPAADLLQQRLQKAAIGLPVDAKRLTPFAADVEAARQSAPIDRAYWTGTPLGVALDALLLERPAAPAAARWLAMVVVHPAPASGDSANADATRLADRIRLEPVDGAQVGWLGIKTELDGLYAHYLDQALLQALLGSLAVVVVIAFHLRSPSRIVATVLPLAAAVAVTLALLALTRQPLGILHLVGLLLVVAVGSNYALFFADLSAPGSAAPDRDTMASLVLANATTVMSFALIAISDVAALSAIGRTVAPGALMALLFSAAMVTRRSAKAGDGEARVVGQSAP